MKIYVIVERVQQSDDYESWMWIENEKIRFFQYEEKAQRELDDMQTLKKYYTYSPYDKGNRSQYLPVYYLEEIELE
jgi:hypothetical protein